MSLLDALFGGVANAQYASQQAAAAEATTRAHYDHFVRMETADGSVDLVLRDGVWCLPETVKSLPA